MAEKASIRTQEDIVVRNQRPKKAKKRKVYNFKISSIAQDNIVDKAVIQSI
jgi:hypothetical protein